MIVNMIPKDSVLLLGFSSCLRGLAGATCHGKGFGLVGRLVEVVIASLSIDGQYCAILRQFRLGFR